MVVRIPDECRVQAKARDGPPPGMDGTVEEWEVRLAHGLAEFSRQHPDLLCDVRPLGFRWSVVCSGSPASVDRLARSVPWDPSMVWLDRRSETGARFAYSPHPSEIGLLRRVASLGGFILPPLVGRAGHLRVRFLSAARSSEGLAGREGEARLIARRRLTAAGLRRELDRIAEGPPPLTPRQTEVLLEAVRGGYYEVPRRSTVEEIARRLHLGRSTTEEHLRSAESHVVRSAASLIARAREPSVGEVDPTVHVARYSSELALYVDLVLRGETVTSLRLLRREPRGVGHEHPHLARILAHLRTGREDLRDIPVDPAVGPFEREVLEELRRIPAGETRTYTEIAHRIGRPQAVRAVGNACAHNPIPVLIPCHRVVPAHGGIGNYSAAGGPETKHRLLEREGAHLTDRPEQRRSGSRPRRKGGDPR